MAVPAGRPPGLPPGLMMALAGPGGPPGPAPGGPLDTGDRPGEAEDPSFDRLIRTAITALHQALQTGEDDQDKRLAAKCMSDLQGLLGDHQKQADAALGMTDVHRGVRRAVRGAGAGAGGGAY